MNRAEITALIVGKLADASNILPSEHREVELAILEYTDIFPKIKKVVVSGWVLNKQHSVATGLTEGTIIEVRALLVCKVASNGYNVGDTANVLNGQYPIDSGRTAGQGISIQTKAGVRVEIYFSIAQQLNIANAFIADATNNGYFYLLPANWDIQFIIFHT